MGREVAESSSAARAVFEAADDALGLSLSRLCFEGPESELLRTEIQQPAILTTSVALLRALEERVAPEVGFLVGHSLGEYTALVAGGSLRFEEAVRLVHARGRFMQEAVPAGRGAMAAILGGTPEDAEQACEGARAATGRVVSAANYNAPAQTVIAGDTVAVEAACSRALQAGARRAVPLPVSAPFHCPLMAPAAEKLAAELAGVRFEAPQPPVISNVDAEPNADPSRIPGLLAEQVTAPVRFTGAVRRLAALGVTRVLEIGPGRVLTGLVARIERRLTRANLSGLADLEAAEAFAAGADVAGGAGER